jgi:hypothetical protein
MVTNTGVSAVFNNFGTLTNSGELDNLEGGQINNEL